MESWRLANPKPPQERLRLTQARIAAFGSTRRAGVRAGDDANIRKLLEAETPVVTIFGKAKHSAQ